MKIDYVLIIAVLKWRFLNEALLRDLKARRHSKMFNKIFPQTKTKNVY